MQITEYRDEIFLLEIEVCIYLLEGLRFVIVALPGLFSYHFFVKMNIALYYNEKSQKKIKSYILSP